MIEKLLKNLHWPLLIYFAYNMYVKYDAFTIQYQEDANRIPTIKQNISKKLKEKEEIDKYYEDIEEAKDRIEKVALEIEKLQAQLPTKVSDTENVEIIMKLAQDVNMQNVKTSPASESIQGFYIIKDYNLEATGTYLQFLVFFEKIAEQSRLFNIGNVDLKTSEKATKGRFQLLDGKVIVKAYRYNTGYREDRGINTIESEISSKHQAKNKQQSAAKKNRVPGKKED